MQVSNDRNEKYIAFWSRERWNICDIATKKKQQTWYNNAEQLVDLVVWYDGVRQPGVEGGAGWAWRLLDGERATRLLRPAARCLSTVLRPAGTQFPADRAPAPLPQSAPSLQILSHLYQPLAFKGKKTTE